MTVVRVALAQLNPTVGDLEGNVAKLIDSYDRAHAADCDLVAFPELSITGYPPEDLVLKPGFVADNRSALERFAAHTRDCAAIVGFVDAGRDIYNAAAAGSDLKRLPTEDEVASAILFMASDLSSGITGQALDVNCGEYKA